jgi:nucleoporin GLE1
MRDMRRGIDKFVTLNVQQISATRDQVRAKGSALAGFVSQQHGAARAHALLTLASKLLSQCEVQVTRLQSFAFPLAEVAVAVAAAHPELGDILMARLNEVRR